MKTGLRLRRIKIELNVDLMTQMEFTKVYDLQGGIRLWRELGYPICEGPLGEEHLCVGEYPVPPTGV